MDNPVPVTPVPAVQRPDLAKQVFLAIIFFAIVGTFGLTLYFFWSVGGAYAMNARTFQGTLLAFHPLSALIAFWLIWSQIIVGSNLRLFTFARPWLLPYHKVQGVFALIFSLAHPAMLFFGLGITEYMKFGFVATELLVYVWLGYFQIFLLLVTTLTALFMKVPWLRTRWRTIHYLNYLLFFLVWIHSWKLGFFIKTSGLRQVWIFYLATALFSITARIIRAVRQKRQRMRSATVIPSLEKQ